LRKSILLNQPATVSALRHRFLQIPDLKSSSAEGATYKSHGEAHGLNIQSYFRVLAGVMPIGKMRVRQNE
jgi:hypothetical protein